DRRACEQLLEIADAVAERLRTPLAPELPERPRRRAQAFEDLLDGTVERRRRAQRERRGRIPGCQLEARHLAAGAPYLRDPERRGAGEPLVGAADGEDQLRPGHEELDARLVVAEKEVAAHLGLAHETLGGALLPAERLHGEVDVEGVGRGRE